MTETDDRTELVSAVEDRLRQVGKVVRRSMLDAMPDGEPSQWLYAPMREYPSRPGKALAPSAVSVGRAGRSVLRRTSLLGIAVAIELLHNAFLVHDDIADGSEMRRGRPTLAATHGLAAALNAGDGLAIVASQVLRRATRRLDRDLADLVWVEFDTMAMRTLEGQATEVGWQLDNVEDLGPEDYLHLIMHKTCWYTTIHPLRVGAIVGSRGHGGLGADGAVRISLRRRLPDPRRSAELVGDERDLRQGDPRRHLRGQAHAAARASDAARQGRRTDCSGARLPAAEREPSGQPSLCAAIRSLMDDYGSITFTGEYAEGILLVAEEYFEQAFADAEPGPDLDFLRSLVPYVWARWR